MFLSLPIIYLLCGALFLSTTFSEQPLFCEKQKEEKVDVHEHEKKMLDGWLTGVRVLTVGHYAAAKHFEECHRNLGIPVIILSTVVGTAVFASIQSSPAAWAQALVGFLSLSAAIFSGLQTFLGDAQLAEKHKRAAVNYSRLRRELDEFCAFPPDRETRQVFVHDFRQRWNALEQEAPTIPDRIYKTVAMEKKKGVELKKGC